MSRDATVGDDSARGRVKRSVRAALFVLAAWFAFGALQVSIEATLEYPATKSSSRDLLLNLTMALYWSAISIPIATWHKWVREHTRALAALVALHAPMVLLAAAGDTLATRLSLHYFAGVTPAAPFIATATYFADFDVLCYIAVVVVADALRARDAMRVGERRAEHLERLLSRARLEYLEAQLQPHFLFNALGAVSELAYEAPATAVRVLRQLALIFRNALASRPREVTLGEELVAIEPYLDIQRLRFPDWLRIDYDVAGDALDCLVPRFVLQPLVENAIRHGLTGRVAAGCIEISASVNNGQLTLRVADNGVGLRASPGHTGYGIGLTNVRERLTTLYGRGDQLRLVGAPGGGAVAEVTLAARRTVDATPVPAPGPLADEDALPNESERERAEAGPALRSRIHPAVIALAVWLSCGVLWSLQSYAYLRIRNRLGHYTLLSLGAQEMTAAVMWALVTPIVVAAATRFPLTRDKILWRAFAYLTGTIALTFLHAAILRALFTPQLAFWTVDNTNAFILNFLIIGVLIAIGHRRQLTAWLRERESAAAMLSAEVRAARRRAARLQTIPPVVLEALDSVIVAVSAAPSPRRTEQLLARLAEYLRVAIECSDEQGVTCQREQSLARALAQLKTLASATLTSPSVTTL